MPQPMPLEGHSRERPYDCRGLAAALPPLAQEAAAAVPRAPSPFPHGRALGAPQRRAGGAPLCVWHEAQPAPAAPLPRPRGGASTPAVSQAISQAVGQARGLRDASRHGSALQLLDGALHAPAAAGLLPGDRVELLLHKAKAHAQGQQGAAAQAALDEAEAIAGHIADAQVRTIKVAYLRFERGLCWQRCGAPSAALGAFEAAVPLLVAVAGQRDLPAPLADDVRLKLALICLARGELERARRELGALCERFARSGATAHLAKAHAGRAEALLRLACRDLADAEGALRRCGAAAHADGCARSRAQLQRRGPPALTTTAPSPLRG